MKKKIIILIILILLFIAGGVFWWEKGEEKEAEEATEESKKETILTPELEKSMDVFVEAIESKEIEDQRVLPEGLQIIKKDDKKIIKNEAEGFQIEVPASFILKEAFSANNFALYDKEIYKEDVVEGGMPPYSVEKVLIFVEENKEKMSLEDYVGNNSMAKEKIAFGEEKGYKVKIIPLRSFEIFQYYILKNNKFYSISIPAYPPENPNSKKYEEVIKGFKFLE